MITINQRIGDPSKLNSMILEQTVKDIRCAIPGIIESFDEDTQTVSARIAIREKLLDKDTDTRQNIEISILVDVPIVIPKAGGYSLTVPVKQGDECLLIFGDMCINSWWANGDVGNQEEERRHDLSDAFAILGTFSQPNKIQNYSTNSIQLRNEDGQSYVEINNNIINIMTNNEVNVEATNNVNVKGSNIIANGTISIQGTAPNITLTGITTVNGNTTINGNTSINGNLSVSGTADISGRASVGFLTVGGQPYESHTHSFSWSGESGSGNTSGPN